MRRRDVVRALGGTAVGLAGVGGTALAQAGTAAQVRQLVDAYAAAWNASDMDAMAKLYTRDVHWVNIVGMHWQGFDQVDRAHRAFFDIMFKGVPIELEEIESVVPLDGGGAIAVVRWSVGTFKTPAGHIVPPSRDRMSLVLLPRDGRLLIAHGANIQIDEKAQQSDPVRRRD